MMSRTGRRRQASFSGKSPPRKPKNVDVRPREYLSEEEVHRLIQAAKGVGRYGQRDAALILLTYRHGLRVSEVIALQWAVVDLKQGRLHAHRLKDGIPAVHPLRGERDSSTQAAGARVTALALCVRQRTWQPVE
jgi:integrase